MSRLVCPSCKRSISSKNVVKLKTFNSTKVVPAGRCPICRTRLDWVRLSWGTSLKWTVQGLIVSLLPIWLFGSSTEDSSFYLERPFLLIAFLAIALFIFFSIGFTGKRLAIAPAAEQSTQSWIAILVVLLMIPTLVYIWVLSSAIYGLGGSHPNQQVLGKVLLVAQQAEQQFCTGIVTTPQGVWLVGRGSKYGRPEKVPKLETLWFEKPAPKSGLIMHDLFGGLGNEQEVSLISRLDKDGIFQVLASVSGAACLVASADGTNVFLLTGVELPEVTLDGEERPYQEDKDITGKKLLKRYQTAVFRTDDQGKTWRLLLEKGFMAKANGSAYNLEPYFHGNNEVWAWGKDQLFYSPDQGVNVEAIESSKDLFKDLRLQGTDTRTVKTHIVQLNKQQAKAWVSDEYWDGVNWNSITREARLTRKEGRWELGEIRSTEGLFIYELKENGSGRIIAKLRRNEESKTILAELAADGYSWTLRSLLPNIFKPFEATSSIRYFFISGDVIVASINSKHVPLSKWFPKLGHYAHARAVYFSNNAGDSWSKLALPDNQELLGFDAKKKQVYWKKGSKYEKLTDPNIYSYGLSR